jgi:nucleotide-binding universal stress UspA family protein
MHDRVVVAVDPRAPGTRAVEEAAVLARSHEAELVVVVAYPTRPTVAERRALDDAPFDQHWRLSPGSAAEVVAGEAVQRARAFAGDARIRTRCEPGRPAAVLSAVAAELGADLLVVELTGTHGPSAITPRVARALERKAPCAVVVVADGTDAGSVVEVTGIEALPA